MPGTWRVLVAATTTGGIHADVVPRDLPSFSREITDKGSWTVNVLPDDPANAAVDFHALTDVGRFSWIVLYDDLVVQAGPVVTYRYDDNTRNLSVSGTGIQGLFDRRVLRNPNGPTPQVIAEPLNDLKLSRMTLRGIAHRIVLANLTQPGGYGLPIDAELLDVPGTHARTYQGYDLATVWDRLDELSKVIGGPELDFRPYLSATGNFLRWEMLIGTPALGDPASNAVWDYGGALGQIDVDVNGSASPCTRAFAKGAGSEYATVVGFADNPALVALGFPPTDFVDSDHTSATSRATLDGYAQADLAAFAAPPETWTCAVRIDGTTPTGVVVSPTLGTWSLGDAPTFGISGHPWIPAGQYRRRVLGFSGNSDSTVDLKLRPTPEVL